MAYCAQDQTGSNNIDEFLAYWETKSTKWWKAILSNNLARTTSIYDLERMLEAYNYRVPCNRFTDVKVTPLAIQTSLQFSQAIIGVQIDYRGYLVGKGIPHWVVLETLHYYNPIHSVVDIYNPFTNHIEPYTWQELMISTGAYKQGIWIER